MHAASAFVRYAPLSGFYLRRADAALVVYDVTDEESLKRM